MSQYAWARRRLNSAACSWWRLLKEKRTYNEDSRWGKYFRHKFRVPRRVFDDIVARARLEPQFADKAKKRGLPKHPLLLKVAAWLRILGKGWDFDTAEEAAHIGTDTLRVFFHNFSTWFVQTYYAEWVKWPEGEELQQMLSTYANLGMPGAVASTDGVHVPWNNAPAGNQYLYVGKEHFPSLAANMSCGHNLKFYACTPLFGGGTNDKTMARWDDFMQAIHRKQAYAAVEFELSTSSPSGLNAAAREFVPSFLPQR